MANPDPPSLLSLRGRLGRGGFWLQAIALTIGFALAFIGIEELIGRGATLLLYPPAAWLALRMGSRRYHDLGRSAWSLLLLLVPLLGPLVVAFELLLRGSARGDNRHGPDPRLARHDYHAVT